MQTCPDSVRSPYRLLVVANEALDADEILIVAGRGPRRGRVSRLAAAGGREAIAA